jgi:hypothetical protein
MQWQDIVLTTGIIVMNIALIPSILGDEKPQLSTSLTTASILGIFAIVYLTLGLLFTTIVSVISCLLWATLAYQSYAKKVVDKA